MVEHISGTTSDEIVASARNLVDRGILRPGDMLPPVRTLAHDLGVHRNTVVSAYKALAAAGVAITQGRRGTSVRKPTAAAEEGFVHAAHGRDVSSGNPDPAWLPSPSRAFRAVDDAPALYGEATIDAGLAHWAKGWITEDQPRPFELLLTAGAVDAIERLLSNSLTRGDAVALEDPCYLTSVNTARRAGYRTVPVPVDEHGMTPEGLRAALARGVRAVVATPRAHNPTGASISAERAAALREVLQSHPHVLVVEDDHFSLLSTSGYHSIVGAEHGRWALVRSVSKFLGPDLRLAFVAADHRTASELALRLGPGTTWVSHLLQRLAMTFLDDETTLADIRAAGEHYRRRNQAFVARLDTFGLSARAHDGLNVWLDTGVAAQGVAALLAEEGWLVRTGAEFSLEHCHVARTLRLTVHDLDDVHAQMLASDIASAVDECRRQERAAAS